MALPVEDLLKILGSFVAGAMLGFERESHNKPAGLRTLILITVGSTIFTILSISLQNSTYDRIASNIVTGVGFVGGGVIFREGTNLKGITTAATIWVAAAIGMAIGFGNYWVAGSTLVFVLINLLFLPLIEKKLSGTEVKRSYKITFYSNQYSIENLEKDLAKQQVKFKLGKLYKNNQMLTAIYIIKTTDKKFRNLNTFLVESQQVNSFEA